MKNNYHTHTTRCMHASGSDESYVLSALKGGFTELGFSDHAPWNYKSRFISGMRMSKEQLPGYVRSIRSLQEKYRDQISIRLGLECEYYPQYIPWLKEIIEEYQLDYLIFGNHYYQTDEKFPYFGSFRDKKQLLKLYLESSLEGMESGLFAYFAHPDLFMRGYPEFDEHCEAVSEVICQKALDLDLPLEYNLEGVRFNKRFQIQGYPHPEFWKIASRFGCKMIIGVDAHNNRQLEESGPFDRAVRFLNDIGGTIVNQISFLR